MIIIYLNKNDIESRFKYFKKHIYKCPKCDGKGYKKFKGALFTEFAGYRETNINMGCTLCFGKGIVNKEQLNNFIQCII